ncbi:MAG: glycerol dehydratase reactivase beta/small subunit family protein [Bacillota bacterium]|nr:glycerol dehydratase reactivase beta/small subunit family protein [Bacillota bacterium]
MEIKRKGDVEKGHVEYTGMSLRHEHVANENLPKINIFFTEGCEEQAHLISYGIEEEGLPRCGYETDAPFGDALEDTVKKGLGVAIGLDGSKAQIFCRQFKKSEPFMNYQDPSAETLRIIGKNAARILKHKPFILEE